MQDPPKLASTKRQTMLLQAGVQVAKSVASILDPDELLRRTVDIICDEFDFYYAGVFLLDQTGEWAVLRAGRGQAGAEMIAVNHKLKVGGNSMIGAATARREARIALDVGEEPVFFKNPHLPHTRSEMGLPLIVGDEVLGALTVQSVKEAAFTQEDIAVLQGMADQLAIAIQNSRLHRKNQALLSDTERRVRLSLAANEVGKKVAAILDLDKLLPLTVDIICGAYDFYYAGIFLLDDTGEWALLHAGRGQAGAEMIAAGHKLAVNGNSMIGTATGLREARIALDVGEEAVFFKNPHLPHTRSEMALPLVVGETVLGAVTIQSVEESAFSQDDITTLQTMADHLAVAIHNAKLLKDLAQANAELLRTKTYEALATATTQAIHWIGNKALPITTTIARVYDDLDNGEIDIESLREDLEMIEKSARLIVQVKEQLIGPAREHQPRAAMVDDVLQTAAFYSEASSALKIYMSAATPMVLADTTQLARAFSSLLQNSLEANATQITATIEPATEPNYVSISISDNGEGIPPDIQEKMWASFVTTKGHSHNGMGLSACLHIIGQLEGSITHQSEPGHGATFTILLPVCHTAAATGNLETAPAKVLLIDDDDAWSQFVSQALNDAGKQATLNMATNGDIDLILVDETLQARPIANVLDELKHAGLVDRTIVVTAAINLERTTDYLRAGVKDVTLKPYTVSDLAELLA